MSCKSFKLVMGLAVCLGLLGSIPGAWAASKLPDGNVPASIKIKAGADAAALKKDIEGQGGKVLSLNPEGTLLVSMPEAKVKVLKVLKNVDSVEEVTLPDTGPAFNGIGKMGVRKPTAEEQKLIDATVKKITSVSANELAIGRAALEGKSPKSAKNAGGTGAIMALPSSVDNSTSNYFPPIGDQGSQGSCTAWATAYYWMTYTQAKDENLNAKGGDTNYICSPAFAYNLINGGKDSGAFPSECFLRFNDVGCASLYNMPYNDTDLTNWPSEAAWIQAINNKTINQYHIDGLNQAGVDAIKQHLANGEVGATTTDCYSNWGLFGSAGDPSRGVSNGVIFSHSGETYTGAHAMCVVGYDDNKSYNDGSTTQYGAFLVANSWGPGWGATNSTGTKGFLWVAYPYFMANNNCFGYIEYNDDRADYRPQLYAVAGLNHTQRGRLALRGGIGSNPASPLWSSSYAINYDGGTSTSITDAKRVAVDLTGGMGYIANQASVDAFVKLYVSGSATTNGTITSADFYHDFNSDGSYGMASSTDPTVTVTPGTNGSADVNFDGTSANSVPVAEAGPDKNVRAKVTVTFSGVGSTDADSDPLTYAWNFGDGGTASGCTVTHSYNSIGTYTVTLTVNDGTDSDTDNCKVTVSQEMVPLADWLEGNIHYHTTNSDGSGSLELTVTYCRDYVDFSCVGDHDYVSNAAQYSTANFLGINGVEATDSNPHVVGFGMTCATGSFNPGSLSVTAILNGGGMPIVSHPEWSKQYSGYNMDTILKNLTGCKHLEVFNWYCQDLWGWGNSEQLWDSCLSANKFYYGTAADDAHGTGRLGYTYNMVGAPQLTVASLKSAFDIGDFYACHSTVKWEAGITVTAYSVSGNTAGETISITTDTGGTIQFIGNNGAVKQTDQSNQATYTIAGNEGYIRVKITNGDGDITWMQPILIEGEAPPPPPPPVIEPYEGYLPITTGGEGGKEIWVTNLNSSGAGSFAAALASLDGTATLIKFSVGGTIYGTHYIYKPNATICGETAPSPGITINGGGAYRCFEIAADDVIIRHMRFREAGGEIIQCWSHSDVIVDHCSLTSCGDGAADFNNGCNHIIFSNNIVADALEGHRTYGEYASFHHNLYTWNNRRQPKIVTTIGPFDFRNNVVEYWGNVGTNCENVGAINVINNWYGPPAPTEVWDYGLIVGAAATDTYVAGNYCEGDPDINTEGNQNSPAPEPSVTTMDANQMLWDEVHRNAGAMPRDAIDTGYAGPAGNTPPVANAGADKSTYDNVTVTFDGSGSYDQDGDQLTYAWAFGDGGTASGKTATHSYTVTGTYTATLTVNDGEDSDTDTCRVEVLPFGVPIADAGPDRTVYVNVAVTFDGSGSSDPEQDPLTYLWNFGDGATGSGCTKTHTYTITGVYTVTLTVDDGEFTDSDTCKVTARTNYPPVAGIKSGNQEVKVNTSVTMDGSTSTDADSDPLTYVWNFGDGATGSGVTKTHTYTVTGTFTCTLTVNDGMDSDDETALIMVRPNYAPVAEAGPNKTINQYGVVGLDGTGSDDANEDTLTYVWDFGDGLTGGASIVNHRYIDVGSYTITLTVSDGELTGNDTCLITVVEPSIRWFYVDKNLGSDTNDGSQASPWKTIQKAADTITSGQGVIVKPATYNEAVSISSTGGTVTYPIIFKAATDEGKVIVNAAGNNIGIDVRKAYVVIDGFRVTGAAQYGIQLYGGAADYGVVRNCQLYGNATGLRCESGAASHIWSNILAYDNTSDGIFMGVIDVDQKTVVRDCTVAQNGRDGVYLYTGWGIINSIVAQNTRYGVSATNTKVALYTDSWSNTSANFNGGITAGTGSFSSDPKFSDPNNNDFHLQANSPCKNAAYDGSDMGYTYPAAYTNVAPVAVVNNGSSFAGQPLAIDGSVSYDPNNDDLTYAWQFGDGSTGSGASVTHTYTNAGNYTVTLTVSDGSLNGTDTAVNAVVSGLTGGDYYVAPWGNDNNAGTAAAPWKTIQKAANSVSAGKKVIVRSGTYAEGVTMSVAGTLAQPIVYLGDNTLGAVTVDGTGKTNAILIGVSYNVLDGFTGINSNQSAIQLENSTTVRSVIRNCVAHNAGASGIRLNYAKDCTIENSVSYNNAAYGIHLYSNADGTLIQNCTLDGNSDDAIYTTTSDCTVKNSILTNNGDYAIDTSSTVMVTTDYNDAWGNTSGNYDDTTKITIGGHSISSDPEFVNRAAGNFNLDTGSPCDNAASDGFDMGYRYPDPGTNNAPIAEAGSAKSLYVYQTVTFDGSATIDPDYDQLTYSWQFGDGTTAAGWIVTHSYTASGTYTATLTVNDGVTNGTDTCVATVKSGLTGDYYVATYGSDSNAGTSAAPWLTIQKAANTMTAGKTTIVRSGTYNERVTQSTSGSSGSVITFRGDTSYGMPLINGAGNSYCFDTTAAYIVVEGFEMTGCTGQVVYVNNDAADYCKFKNLIIHGGGSHGIKINYGDNVTIENCLVYDQDNQGIFLNSNADGATIKQCTVHGNTLDGMYIHTSDTTVQDCIITSNGGYGIDSYGTVAVSTDYNDVWSNTSGSYDDTTKISVGAHSFSSDPKFVNSGSGDFHLQGTSPCKSKASDGGDMGYRY